MLGIIARMGRQELNQQHRPLSAQLAPAMSPARTACGHGSGREVPSTAAALAALTSGKAGWWLHLMRADPLVITRLAPNCNA